MEQIFLQLNKNLVYKIDKESHFINETFGYWNVENGLTDLRVTRILSRRRSDFRGKVLKSTLIVTKNESIDQLNDHRLSHIDFPAKIGYAITNILGESVNSTVIYNFENTWGYGDMKKPDKLIGMMGQLVRNEIDIGGTVLFITPDRVPHIEYLSCTLLARLAFVFRDPPLSQVSNLYYLPFSGMVWICGIILVVVSTSIIFVTYQFSKDNEQELISTDFFVFSLCLIFIYTSYTANIVALLQSTSGSIRTLTDLLNSNMELAVDDTPYSRFYFSTETEPIRKKIYETKVAPPNQHSNFVNVSYGIGRMRKGLYAFHTELATGYKNVKDTFYEHEKCGLVEIEYLRIVHPWHGIHKHSPYKEIFKVSLFKIRETGIQAVELARRQTHRPTCVLIDLEFPKKGDRVKMKYRYFTCRGCEPLPEGSKERFEEKRTIGRIITWNRDTNAGRNILYKGLCI
ncbi:ionotropic receptor 75a-like [Contarinia nasturtii]|uniref:ionotropic receptor 75a-like n=1 Tax=Contarinia nasturtii TaxID=265458 RepID=UPI0012D428FE|nr:ionotropic receptor 75a-like [Contarinia nasturtii]